MKRRQLLIYFLVMVALIVPIGSSTALVQGESPQNSKLVKRAQAEGKVAVYAVTSLIANAAQAFEAKYHIKVESSQLSDGELIQKVTKEGNAKIKGADFVLCQDGGRVFGELIKPGYVYNYVPASMRNQIPKSYRKPLVFNFCNKLFIFNSEKSEKSPISNVWELTETKWRGRLHLKDPFQEGVNMNFLTMVIQPKVAAQLAKAYQQYYGKKLKLTTKNAGYEWIKALFQNGIILGTSDTKISEAVGVRKQPEQLMGLFTYNKIALAKGKNLALKASMQVAPFAGFYYPQYVLIVKNAAHPNAAKLFIEYLLTKEGHALCAAAKGDYSSNITIQPDEGDYPLSVWEKILVREDPVWCFQHRADVEDFVNKYIH
jgi:iron(III) transport system substrate-binding protein